MKLTCCPKYEENGVIDRRLLFPFFPLKECRDIKSDSLKACADLLFMLFNTIQ